MKYNNTQSSQSVYLVIMVFFYNTHITGVASYVKGLQKRRLAASDPEKALTNFEIEKILVDAIEEKGAIHKIGPAGRNKYAKILVQNYVDIQCKEVNLLVQPGHRINMHTVRQLRRTGQVDRSPSEILEPMVLESDGRPVLTASHLTTNPSPREVIGPVMGYQHEEVGLFGAVDVNDSQRIRWGGGIPFHSTKLGVGNGQSVRCIRVWPERLCSGGGGSFAEYGPVWKINGPKVYLDIPLLKLSKRNFLGVAKKWKTLTPSQQAWWIGCDRLLGRIMDWHAHRKVMRYFWSQCGSAWSVAARDAGAMKRERAPVVGEDQAWFGVDHFHQFPIFNQVAKAFNNLGTHIGNVVGGPWFSVFTAAGLLAAGLYYAQTRTTMLIHFLQFFQSIRFSESQADVLRNCINKALEAKIEAVPVLPSVDAGEDVAEAPRIGTDQIGGDAIVPLHYLLPIFGTVIIMAIMGTVSATKIGNKTWDTVISRFSRMGNCISSFEKATTWGQKFGETLEHTIAQYVFGAPSGVFDHVGNVNRWCDEVSALATTNFEDRVQTDRTLRPTIDRLLMEGNEIGRSLLKFNFSREQGARYYKTHALLFGLRAKATEGNPTSMKMRPVPLLIHFVGDTGVGKSTLLDSLCTELLVEMGFNSETMLEDYVYHYKASKDGFWSGYHDGIKIIICDDMFCLKDVPGMPSAEALDTIGMANTAPFPLTMADLSSKGSTYMNAEVIIWTTNRRDYDFPSMTNPEAIFNRIDLQYSVTPKAQYARPDNIRGKTVVTLDRARIQEELAKDQGSLINFTEYQRLNPKASAEECIGARCDFEEMAREVISNLNSKANHFVNIKEARKSVLKRALERRRVEAMAKVDIPPLETLSEVKTTMSVDTPVPGLYPAGKVSKVEHLEWADDAHGEGPSGVSVGQDQFWHPIPWVIKAEGWFPRRYHCDVLAYYLAKADRYVPAVWLGIPVDLPAPKCLVTSDIVSLKTDIEEYVRANMMGRVGDAWAALIAAATKKGIKVAVCESCTLGYTWRTFETEVRKPRVDVKAMIAAAEDLSSDKVEWPTPAGWAVIAASIAVVALAIGGLVWWLVSRGEPSIEPEAYNQTDKGVTRVETEAYSVTDKGAKTVQTEASGVDEALVDGNAFELSLKLQKNLYILQKKTDDEWVTKLQVFFIFGRVALTNRHLIRALSKEGKTEWRLVAAHYPTGYKFEEKQMNLAFPPDEGDRLKDLMMIEFPPCVPQHRDMRSHIIDRADMSKFSSLGRVSLTTHVARSKTPVISVRTSDRLKALDTWYCAAVGETAYRRIRSYYQYGCDTEKGECGGVLVVNDPSFTKKIIGIHSGGIAGDAMPAIAQPISQEIIVEYMTHFKPRAPDSVISLKTAGVDECDVTPDEMEGHAYVGVDQLPTYANSRTNIHPSVIAEELWEAKTKPAHLTRFVRDGEVRDPMRKARDKVLGENAILDGDVLDIVVNDVSQMIAYPDLGVGPEVMSWRVGIEGVVGNEFFPPINRKTSPGYGWNKAGGGKAQYFGRDAEYIFDHPQVTARREEYMEQLRRGERLCVKWEDSLKDERRPIEKVEAGKTRMFSVGCQVYTVIFRQYFMAFQAQVMKGRILNEIAVGINVYNFDWSALAYRMQSKGGLVLAGDFSNYDGTLGAEIMWRVLDVIEDFYRQGESYTEEDALIRRLLWSDIVYSIHVNGKHCYMWPHSNPSGCPITTILNSVYHCIVARYVFVQAAREAGVLGTMRSFRDNVAFVCYGDDDIWNISDEISGWFNMATITKEFAKIGMVYTDETKQAGALGFKRLDEIRFLKRAFARDPGTGRFRAPLEIGVIMEMPRWIRGKKNEWELAAEVLEEAAEELALHEREVFDEIMVRFQKAQRVLSTRVECRLDTYEGYQWRLSERARK